MHYCPQCKKTFERGNTVAVNKQGDIGCNACSFPKPGDNTFVKLKLYQRSKSECIEEVLEAICIHKECTTTYLRNKTRQSYQETLKTIAFLLEKKYIEKHNTYGFTTYHITYAGYQQLIKHKVQRVVDELLDESEANQ